ncbi:MAG: NTP transferase domain-containing protein, partial [Myxococcales bacterium]|nr:NTP transferase domain-containing protein [Myxococcales bacterium]
GPMEGLAVGLAALRGRAEAAFVTSTDAPFVVPAFVARLHALLGDRAICAPAIGGRRQPLGAIYRVSLADDVAARAARGEGRLQDLLDTHPTRLVTAEELLADEALRRADPTLTSLDNLNTPADYQRALASDR